MSIATMSIFGVDWPYLLTQPATYLVTLGFICLVVALLKYNRLSKPFILLIGLVTAWTAIYWLVFLLAWVSIFAISRLDPLQGLEYTLNFYASFKAANYVTLALELLLLIFYFSHVLKSPLHTRRQRFLYAIGLMIVPFIVMPAYYLHFIRKETTSSSTQVI
jgi:hypothetical protein